MALTPKQKLFVKAYLSNGQNITQAALSAGYSTQGDRHVARVIGQETLRVPAVREVVTMGLAEQEVDLDRKAKLLGITKAKLLGELASHIQTKPTDFFDVTREEGIEGEDDFMPQRLKIKSSKDWSSVAKRAVKKIKIDGRGGIELELYSKHAAIDQTAKLLGWTKEQFEISGQLDQATTVNIMLPDNGYSVQKPATPEAQQNNTASTESSTEGDSTPEGEVG